MNPEGESTPAEPLVTLRLGNDENTPRSKEEIPAEVKDAVAPLVWASGIPGQSKLAEPVKVVLKSGTKPPTTTTSMSLTVRTVIERLRLVCMEHEWQCLGVEVAKCTHQGKGPVLMAPNSHLVKTLAHPVSQDIETWRQRTVMTPDDPQRQRFNMLSLVSKASIHQIITLGIWGPLRGGQATWLLCGRSICHNITRALRAYPDKNRKEYHCISGSSKGKVTPSGTGTQEPRGSYSQQLVALTSQGPGPQYPSKGSMPDLEMAAKSNQEPRARDNITAMTQVQGIASYKLKNGPSWYAGNLAKVAGGPAWMNKEILTELKHEKEAYKRWQQGQCCDNFLTQEIEELMRGDALLAVIPTSKLESQLGMAALNPFIPQPVLIPGVVLTQVQDPALGFVEPHEVHISPLLELVQVPLDGILSLRGR
ncbi:hypothetical protein QYF61_011735 [Mycteria americana]|uniref:Uncharacterized protein n=1 Tax=Mycteria americana TaxID=33587 RepID=A0AAN7PEK6_MYCAM|nr:hypothetical protein QYF61_011735 [Mycteria americana]